jgi:hypothetical protein
VNELHLVLPGVVTMGIGALMVQRSAWQGIGSNPSIDGAGAAPATAASPDLSATARREETESAPNGRRLESRSKRLGAIRAGRFGVVAGRR